MTVNGGLRSPAEPVSSGARYTPWTSPYQCIRGDPRNKPARRCPHLLVTLDHVPIPLGDARRAARELYPMGMRHGITVLELCVVFAIAVALLGLMLPAVQSMRERARETVCRNNVHQMNFALAQFAKTHNQLPRPNSRERVGGWMVELLPFIEQGNLERSVPIGLATSGAPEALFQPPSLYRCPRRAVVDNTPANTLWPGHYVLVPASRRDSYLLFDAPLGLNVPWISGPELPYDAVVRAEGPHRGGFFFGRGFQQGVDFMIDGRVMR